MNPEPSTTDNPRSPRSSRLPFAGALLIFALLTLCGVAALLNIGSAQPQPNPPAQGTPQIGADAWQEKLRETIITGEWIAGQKEALVQEYARVTPGTRSEELYRQHEAAFFFAIGENPPSYRPPMPPPPALFTPVPTMVAAIVPSVDMTTAWGTRLDIQRIPVVIDAQHAFSLHTITSDGRFLVGSITTPLVDPSPFYVGRMEYMEPARVVLVDVRTRQVTEVHRLPDKKTSAFDMTADSAWIAWVEAADTNGVTDGAVYAYNHSTGHSTGALKRIPAGSGDRSGTVPGPYGFTLESGSLFWVEGLPNQARPGTRALKRADLTTGQVELVAEGEGVHGPIISGQYSLEVETYQVPGPQTRTRINVLNTDTGEKRTLRNPNTSDFALHQDWLAWTTVNHEVVLTNLEETTQHVLASGAYVTQIGGVSLNSRLVVWNSDPRGQVVWDRAQGRLVRLGDVVDGNGSMFVAGKMLVWRTAGAQSGDPIINVLDTTTLP